MRTRAKICGITSIADAHAAAQAGADAIGLVFYAPSPRFLSLRRAQEIREILPPFLTSVALFVNPTCAEVEQTLADVRPNVLQFHGEETPEFCAAFGTPYIKACRVKEGIDLLEYLKPFHTASAWLVDAYVEGYGGAGVRFDWSVIPAHLERPLILSGGLDQDNVAEAIRTIHPWGVDVSTGVESARGVKDSKRIVAFMSEVRNADG